MHLKQLFIPVLLGLASCATKPDITVSNPSGFDRSGEMVEVDASVCPQGPFAIVDAEGEEVPYQLTSDGKLIFPASVKANSSATYRFVQREPAAVDSACYGRIFPERKDDLAWENDRSAYRAYGPALQSSGEKAYGYDIWTKSVDTLILEQRFRDDIQHHISFHEDHGNGMDVYAVGPTLGGGTSALCTAADSIIYPYCWEKAEVLDNGPLRFSALLTYPATVIGSDTIVETRKIVLDRGSYLNKTEISYAGLPEGLHPLAGIVVHDSNAEGYTLLPDANAIGYADKTQQPDADNGIIYVGIVAPEAQVRYKALDEPAGEAIGHVIADFAAPTFTYYWGSGWSKGGIKDSEAWTAYLRDFSTRLQEPLKVEVMK